MLKKLSYFIIGVIICCILILSYGKAEVKYTVSDKRKAIVETAEAYLKKVVTINMIIIEKISTVHQRKQIVTITYMLSVVLL